MIPSLLRTLPPLGDFALIGLFLSTWSIPILRFRKILILCQFPSSTRTYIENSIYHFYVNMFRHCKYDHNSIREDELFYYLWRNCRWLKSFAKLETKLSMTVDNRQWQKIPPFYDRWTLACVNNQTIFLFRPYV